MSSTDGLAYQVAGELGKTGGGRRRHHSLYNRKELDSIEIIQTALQSSAADVIEVAKVGQSLVEQMKGKDAEIEELTNQLEDKDRELRSNGLEIARYKQRVAQLELILTQQENSNEPQVIPTAPKVERVAQVIEEDNEDDKIDITIAAEMAAKVESLEKQVALLQKQVNEAQESLSLETERADQLAEQLEQALEIATEAEQRAAELAQETQEQKEKAEKLNNKLAQARKDRESIATQMAERKNQSGPSRLVDVTRERDDLLQRVLELEADLLREHESQTSSQSASPTAAFRRAADLEEALRKEQAARIKLDRELRSAAKNSSFSSPKEKVEAPVSQEWKEEKKQLELQLNETKKQINELQMRYDRKTGQVQQLQREIEELKGQKETQENRNREGACSPHRMSVAQAKQSLGAS